VGSGVLVIAGSVERGNSVRGSSIGVLQAMSDRISNPTRVILRILDMVIV